MKRLELPRTIRTANIDDVPNEPGILGAISDAATANIVEGYTLQTDIADGSLFQFYAEINVDNSRLWNLTESLLAILPDKISFIFGYIDHELSFSDYDDKEHILATVSSYSVELSQDGFLEFGFIYHGEDMLTEIFIKKSKYIQFWGTSLKLFIEVMNEFSLYEVEDLNFIDEYPMVTESLSNLFPEYADTSQVINYFREAFKK